MGILDNILGPSGSKFRQYAGNTLSDLGYGFANSTNAGDAFGAATRIQAARQPARDAADASAAEAAARQKQITDTTKYLQAKFPDLAAAVSSGLPLSDAWNEAMKRSQPGYGDPNWGKTGPAESTDIQNYQYGLTHPGFNDYQTQKGGAAETALTPTWGIDNDPKSPTYGQKVLGQLNKAGKFVRTELPAGVSALDPVDLQGQKTGATVDAKTAAAARAALPGAQQAFDLANKAADALLNDTAGMSDQFGNTLGFPNQMFPMARPGSDMARFRTELAQGQGNAFLQARQVLKGAGQVTDYEGAKAESAYSRMELAAKNNNQQEFVIAVQDFKQAVAEGYQKIQAAAQGDYAKDGPGVTGGQAQGNGGKTSSGLSWSLN